MVTLKRTQLKKLAVAFSLAVFLQESTCTPINGNHIHPIDADYTEGFRLSARWARKRLGESDFDSLNVTSHLDEKLSHTGTTYIDGELDESSKHNPLTRHEDHSKYIAKAKITPNQNQVRDDSVTNNSRSPINKPLVKAVHINDKSLRNSMTPRVPLKHAIDRRIDRGRITCDFGTNKSKLYARSLSLLEGGEHEQPIGRNATYDRYQQEKIRISMDPLAFSRLIPILFFASTSFFSAVFGTLRLLAPLVISKRIIVSIGNLVSDWYTGRYFRKTYSRFEKTYIHFYETPASFRALSRMASQWLIYLLLARVMGWMVGTARTPCRSDKRGLAFYCGLLWIGSVTGAGHAFAEAVAIWGGPLRLQAVQHTKKVRLWKAVIKPWHILQWMQNPEEWISMIAEPERKPFNPNPFLYPMTWIPLRLLQMVAVAQVAATEPADYMWCSGEVDQIRPLIRKYLLQLALCDEWVRVFIREKRIGLGIVVAIAYYFAMLSLLVSSAMINGKATILMIPSLVANIISTWMNIVEFINRRATRRKNRYGGKKNDAMVWPS